MGRTGGSDGLRQETVVEMERRGWVAESVLKETQEYFAADRMSW